MSVADPWRSPSGRVFVWAKDAHDARKPVAKVLGHTNFTVHRLGFIRPDRDLTRFVAKERTHE